MTNGRRNPTAQCLAVLSGVATGYLAGARPWINRWRAQDIGPRFRGAAGFWHWSTSNSHLFWSEMGAAMVAVGAALVVAGLLASTTWTAAAGLSAAGLGVAWLLLLRGSGFTGRAWSDLQTAGWVAVVAGAEAALTSLLVRARVAAFRARVSRTLRAPAGATRPATAPIGVMDPPTLRPS